MRTVYFDLISGAAGDMLLASMVDLGFPLELLENQLRKLPIEPVKIEVEKVQRSGIRCTLLTPRFPHSHEHRHLGDILALMRGGEVPPEVLKNCEKVLNRLAEAESKVHGIPKEHVHFHEIGALDTIVDVLGFCMALDHFRIGEVRFSTMTDGYGTIKAAHGEMPVPVPATAVMIHGLKFKTVRVPTELLTPTGAALLTALGVQSVEGMEGVVAGTGYGAGSKTFQEHPNFIRAHLFESTEKSPGGASGDRVIVLESDMDHVSGEIMGDAASLLFEAGALDVCWIPVYMKKGRPGYRLSVIAPEGEERALTDLIIRHTRTLGVRCQSVGRTIAERVSSKTVIAGTECEEKRCSYKDYSFAKPEYEALAALARSKGCSVLDLMEEYFRSGMPQ